MLKKALPALILLTLAACSPSSPYVANKSAANVPTHIDVINLRDIYITTGGDEANGDPKRDPSPSQNDQEVLAVARTAIVNQFANYGYKIVEGPNARADVAMKFFVGYMPERWPLIDRSVSVTGRIYDMAGNPILGLTGAKGNPAGLIGAMVGPSRDEMVSQAARDAVTKVVNEMRKGTLANTPVSSIAPPQPAPAYYYPPQTAATAPQHAPPVTRPKWP